MRIPLALPSIGELERVYVSEAISSGWISGTGPHVAAFERSLATKLRRDHVVAVSSGTTALEVALLACGIGPGDEVLVPALTFVAPAAAVRTVGARPVLCDVTAGTWTIDPAEAASLLSGSTKAIIAVDLMGHPCDYDALSTLGLPIIEDAAQAHGSSYRSRSTGSFGRVSIMSFHANKTITTGEGGCIATDDPELAERMRLIVNHGMSPDRPYHHDVVGRNARMTNLAAALGVAQVERWDELVSAHRRVGEHYERLLTSAGIPGRAAAPWADCVCWLQPVRLHSRDAVVTAVRAQRIDVRAVWPALSTVDLYRDAVRRPCPVAEHLSAQLAWLPTWSAMPDSAIQEVVTAVVEAARATRMPHR
jgi:perosamine synthetase